MSKVNPNDLLVVRHNYGTVVLNKTLLDTQDRWDYLPKIKMLHFEKLCELEQMDNIWESKPVTLRDSAHSITELEFKLQEAWGFELNSDFHYWDETPGCLCKKPNINSDCIVHGLQGILVIEDIREIVI